MTRTSLIYVGSAVLGVAAGIATLAGVQSGRIGGNDILLACPASDPRCDEVQPTEQILLACEQGDAGCDPFRSTEQIAVACQSGNSSCGNDYRSDTNILIALANRGVEDGNG